MHCLGPRKGCSPHPDGFPRHAPEIHLLSDTPRPDDPGLDPASNPHVKAPFLRRQTMVSIGKISVPVHLLIPRCRLQPLRLETTDLLRIFPVQNILSDPLTAAVQGQKAPLKWFLLLVYFSKLGSYHCPRSNLRPFHHLAPVKILFRHVRFSMSPWRPSSI